MSIDISAGLGGEGGRIGSSYTCNLYLDCLGGDLSPKCGMAVGGGSGLQGIIGGDAGLGRGIGCNFGPKVFLLAPALPCPFLGSNGRIIL